MKNEKIKNICPYAIPGVPRYYLEDTIVSTNLLRPHLEDVKRLVCEVLGTDLNVLDKHMFNKPNKEEFIRKRKGSTEEISTALHICIFIAHRTSSVSLQRVGEVVGGRDHSTIHYAIKKVEGLCEIYPDYRRKINTILFRMGQPQVSKRKWNIR